MSIERSRMFDPTFKRLVVCYATESASRQTIPAFRNILVDPGSFLFTTAV